MKAAFSRNVAFGLLQAKEELMHEDVAHEATTDKTKSAGKARHEMPGITMGTMPRRLVAVIGASEVRDHRNPSFHV